MESGGKRQPLSGVTVDMGVGLGHTAAVGDPDQCTRRVFPVHEPVGDWHGSDYCRCVPASRATRPRRARYTCGSTIAWTSSSGVGDSVPETTQPARSSRRALNAAMRHADGAAMRARKAENAFSATFGR